MIRLRKLVCTSSPRAKKCWSSLSTRSQSTATRNTWACSEKLCSWCFQRICKALLQSRQFNWRTHLTSSLSCKPTLTVWLRLGSSWRASWAERNVWKCETCKLNLIKLSSSMAVKPRHRMTSLQRKSYNSTSTRRLTSWTRRSRSTWATWTLQDWAR